MTEHHEPIADSFDVAGPHDPDWYKRAVFYEVLVRGFQDSTGDGTGDLRGLTSRLDYLEWLGIDCIWLLPIYSSPLRDGGYDISDFMAVLPDYGNIGNFVTLVDEAHKRGIRVIANLVMNHTSDQHPWFQASRSDPRWAVRRLLRVGRHRRQVLRRPGHLRRHRAVQLDLRPGPRPVLLAPVLRPPAGPELREPHGPGRDARGAAVLAGPRHRRLPARRRALPVRAGGHQLREPEGDARVPEAGPGRDRQALPGHACCWPRRTSGPPT